MILFFYKIGLFLYQSFVWLFSFTNQKAQLWIEGRKMPIPDLTKSAHRVWFHCASLGEFEQAKPIIDKFIGEGNYSIVLTFFSPSGYEYKKDLPYEWVGYIPFDLKFEYSQFIDKIKPTVAVFVRYELWYNTIKCVCSNKIPLFLVNASFRKNHLAFSYFLSTFYSEIFSCFNSIFVLDYSTQKLISSLTSNPVLISGDSRLDRVLEQKDIPFNDSVIENFLKNESDCFIAGSSWKEDLEIIQFLFEKTEKKLIIFPHQIYDSEISDIINLFGGKVHKYSEGANQKFIHKILIVNMIGILSSSYRYAAMAYVGGGFGVSVHNVLEPIVYGIPVICGPNIDKSPEAKELTKLNICFPVKNNSDANKALEYISLNRKQITEKVNNYIKDECGGTELIFEKLKEFLN